MKKIIVFGVDQSPWVQGVLYALSLNNIDYKLTSVPPSFLWPFKYGLVIPIVSIGEEQVYDSFNIYKRLNLSDHNISEDELKKLSKKLERLFILYSLGRCHMVGISHFL